MAIIFGLFLTGIIFSLRFLTVSGVSVRTHLSGETKVLAFAFARGLTSAVIGLLPIQYGLEQQSLILNIVNNVLLFSNLFMAVALSTISEYRYWRLRLEETLKN